jgi:hypothetical protein
MHPLESMKFTDEEVRNAVGSDFYQRDRSSKMKKAAENKGVGKNQDAAEDQH